MKENNRNNLKIEKQPSNHNHSFIKLANNYHEKEEDFNKSYISNDHSVNQFTPITHAEKDVEYRRALHLCQANHKTEALSILSKLFDELTNSQKSKRTQFIMMVNTLLNIWKIYSEVQKISGKVVEKLRKHIPVILERQENFKDLNQKIRARINLLLIIYIKEELQVQNIQKAHQLAKEFEPLICVDSQSDEIKFKFRFVRIKIYNKLQKRKEQLEEILACENLLKQLSRKIQPSIGADKKNKELLRAKLQNRKKQLKEEIKKFGDDISRPYRHSFHLRNNLESNKSKTLKLLNFESTLNTLPKQKSLQKPGRSLSLHKLKKNGQSRVQDQNTEKNKYLSLEKHKSPSNGTLGLNTNSNHWNSKREKGKTMHLSQNEKKKQIKYKSRPGIEYKKLAKKTLHIKFKQNDVKDLLSDLKTGENINNYQDMLLQRPFGEKKQKNKANQSQGEKQSMNQNTFHAARNQGNEQTCEQPSENKLIEKKDLLINSCIEEIQQETLARFYQYITNRHRDSENTNDDFLLEENNSHNYSELSEKESNIKQSNTFAYQINRFENNTSTQRKLFFSNIVLPYQQNTYKMKLTYNQISRMARQKEFWVKILLSNDNKSYYYAIKYWKQKTNQTIFSQNLEKQQKNKQQNEVQKSDKSKAMQKCACEKQCEFLKYFKDFQLLKMAKISIPLQNKLMGKTNLITHYENQQQVNQAIDYYITHKKEKNQLLLSKQTVKIYVHDKKTFQSIDQWHSKFQPFQQRPNSLNFILYYDKNVCSATQPTFSLPLMLKKVESCGHKWRQKKQIYKIFKKMNKKQKSITKVKKDKNVCYNIVNVADIENSQKPKNLLGWIKTNSTIISQYLMGDAGFNTYKPNQQLFLNAFYLAVKSFMFVDHPNIRNIVNLFFDIQNFDFVSCLGKSSKNKTYKITVRYLEVKDLYKINRRELPIFMKFRIQDKNIKTQIHKFILTDSDLRNILPNQYLKILRNHQSQKEKQAQIFGIFQAIISQVYIYKKITYSHAGVATQKDSQDHIYKANKQKYIQNKYLLKPAQFLSPYLESIIIVYQGPIRIECDKSYAIVSVIKVRETQNFDLRIYVPKYQRIYSFSFSHEIFQYLNKNQLEQIFSSHIESSMKMSKINSINLEGIKNILYAENTQKYKSLWNKIIRIFKFYRKFNAQRSYLIVKISSFEAFTKDCAICEYFSIKKTQSPQNNERESTQTISRVNCRQNLIRVQISMQMNKSGLNFQPKMATGRRKKQRSVKTIFANRSLEHSEQNSGDSSKTYHESLENIYQSETNKYIIYVSFIDTLTSQKIVYSYFLCELVHLLQHQFNQNNKNQDDTSHYPKNSLFFKEKTLNHATLWRVLDFVKNTYQFQLQSQANFYMPDLFSKKQLMDLLKRDVDSQLLKNKKSQKISLNSSIFEKPQEKQDRKKQNNEKKMRKKNSNEEKRIGRVSLLPENYLYSELNQQTQMEEEKEIQHNILFLHKKILLLAQKCNPISCIIYNSMEGCLKIYINNYKKARIKQLQIDSREHSLPYMLTGTHSLSNVLKAMRKRLYRYHQNLMMLM